MKATKIKSKETEPLVRCAIYTRKSSEEGLEQRFNSLDAQRESGEAYIASQKHRGWVCSPTRYDDGGFSGGSIERPAIRHLLADIQANLVDCVVVYKVDRLSRSLPDFARMMETFEQHKVSFVSVTQHFDTTHSMGRLTLNMLLSFAQFEREIISERTRDKIAASRRRGMWAGGRPVLGYELHQCRLTVKPDEAEQVRAIFALYLEKKSLLATVKVLNARGWRTKRSEPVGKKPYGGAVWDKPRLYNLLTNPVVIGKVRHKSEQFDGEHEAIVSVAVFEQVQSLLKSNGICGGSRIRNKYGALLRGLLSCGHCGVLMGHTTTNTRANRVYRYYTCYTAQKQGRQACPCGSLPGDQIERFVVEQIKRIGKDPALRSQTLSAVRQQAALESEEITKEEVDAALEQFDSVWSALSTGEQVELMQLVVQGVRYDAIKQSVSISFNPLGLRSLGQSEESRP